MVHDDPVNHPSHYCDGGIETLDFILAKKMDFLTGQVCKYISRAGKKDPDKEIEDLEKARFYLNKRIDVLKSKRKSEELMANAAGQADAQNRKQIALDVHAGDIEYVKR